MVNANGGGTPPGRRGAVCGGRNEGRCKPKHGVHPVDAASSGWRNEGCAGGRLKAVRRPQSFRRAGTGMVGWQPFCSVERSVTNVSRVVPLFLARNSGFQKSSQEESKLMR